MTQSFNNQSVNEVALTLARRKVSLRHGFGKPMDKLALDLSSSLQGVGDWLKDNPVAQKALIGAGIGGTLGLGSSLFRRGKKHPFRDALTGALAGGTIGGGFGLIKDRKNISDRLFPSTDDVPGLLDPDPETGINKIEELNNLAEKAGPPPELGWNPKTWQPLQRSAQTFKEHPYLSTLGIGSGLNVGSGMHIAAQGKNTSPSAWKNAAKVLSDQTGKFPDKMTQLEKIIRDVTSSGEADSILDSLKRGEFNKLSKRPDALKVMQSLRHIDGMYRPMTASQYALQKAQARLLRPGRQINPSPLGKFGWKPNTWKPLQRGLKAFMDDLSPRDARRLERFVTKSLVKIPKTLPNIPKSGTGKAALMGIPISLIIAWLSLKNTTASKDNFSDIKQHYQNPPTDP